MADFNPRNGTLGTRLAKHLLRRTTFNFNKERIDDFAKKTAAEAVNELFKFPDLQLPKGPISYKNGKYIVDSVNGNDDSLTNSLNDQLVINWFIYESIFDYSIRHKLVWFLHTCFVTSGGSFANLFYYVRLLQEFADKNLRVLTEKIVLDNNMLRFLDNNKNTKNQPNENFARELLELFTILKGPQVGPGNYTTYTEGDIGEAAKVLTGFANSKQIDKDTGLIRGRAIVNRHSTEDKQFSASFQNKVIKGRNTEEGMYEELSEFIQMIYDQEETARSFCRRIYRFFVREDITNEIERDIIHPLASELKANDYVLRTVLEKLFISKHFYDEDDNDPSDEIIGGKIKSPIDYMFNICTFFDLLPSFPDPKNINNGDAERYAGNDDKFFSFIRLPARNGYIRILSPPSVLGYTPYAQAPSYGDLWIDGSTIIDRLRFPENIIAGKVNNRWVINERTNFRLDIVNYVDKSIDNPGNPDALIQQLVSYLLPEQPSKSRMDYFKELLLSELPEMDWTLDWNLYKQTSDPEYVRSPLEKLIKVLLKSPEYQTF